MFNKDEKIRGIGESCEYTRDMLNEIIRCKEDIIYFARNYVYIETLDYGKKLFEPFEYQKKILKHFVAPADNERMHSIILQPRQSGKTTVTTAYILHYALFSENKNIFIIANKEKTAMEIMRRIQLAYKDLPLWMQQGISEWNKGSMVLENETRITAATTSPDSISGQTVNLLYIDEFAKVPAHVAEDFITATYPVISSGKTSKIIITSTPTGLNHFYEFWAKAVKSENNFYPVKVGWWEHPNRGKEWKQNMIRDIGMLRWNQEFACKFLGSQDTLIDSDILEMIKPAEVLELKYGSLMKIYEKPIPNETYIMGVDSATGVGADYSVIQVLRIIDPENIIQVATYRYNRIALYEFAQVAVAVSQYYNDAKMMVENNLGGEDLCNTIWYTHECENIVNFDNLKLGIRATPKTKLAAVLNLKRYVENGWLTIADRETLDELSRYIEVRKGIFEAGTSKQHDDLVAGLYWAVYYMISDEFKDEYSDGEAVSIKDKYRLDRDDAEQDDEYDDTPIEFFYSD